MGTAACKNLAKDFAEEEESNVRKIPPYIKWNDDKDNPRFIPDGMNPFERSDVYALLKDSDIFIFPTLNGNHSMALLEAINMHCAVVATNVGGNPESIEDGKTGLLIEPKNSQQIIEALLKMKDTNLRKKYSDAAFEFASSHFSMNNTLGKLDELFEK